MKTTETFLMDRRMLDPHWATIFRLRLAGWLPRVEAAEAASQGLVTVSETDDSSHVELTDAGRDLTDIRLMPNPDENVELMAIMLAGMGITAADLDLSSAADAVFLAPDDRDRYDRMCEQIKALIGQQGAPSV